MRPIVAFLFILAFQSAGFGQHGDDPNAAFDERFDRAAKHHLRGEFEQAFAIYDEILAERGEDVPTLITYANMKWKTGDMPEAEKRFHRAIKKMPHHIKARQWLGQMYLFQGRRKLAREQYTALINLDFIRPDVLHSAWIGLAKLDLVEENWARARKGFRKLRAEGEKSDAATGGRGLKKIRQYMKMDDWARLDSKHLYVHFSERIKDLDTAEKRKAFVDPLDVWIEETCARLEMHVPDPWHVYVFEDDGECSVITGRDHAHGWDTGWWVSFWSHSSGIPIKQTLGMQLIARSRGSRPKNRPMVEGLSAYLAGWPTDPHERIRQRYPAVESFYSLHQRQRGKKHLDYGMSFVRYLIDTYGFEKFMVYWARFNSVANAPQYRKPASKSPDWNKILGVLLRDSFGASLEEVEAGWRTVLAKK